LTVAISFRLCIASRFRAQWFIAGYSFPATDGHINGLLRASYRDDKEIW
jgi:hypothetical protein